MGQKFFISFNSADRDKAHWIAWTLVKADHEVAVYDWEIPAGGNIPLWMSKKLAWADRLIAVISPDYVPSRYSPMEWASRIWDDPDGTKGSVIPVIVRLTPKMPPLLKGLSWIDLTNCSEDEARRRLIKGVDMPAPPELMPAFEKIEGEPPDSQHVGPAEEPIFDKTIFDEVVTPVYDKMSKVVTDYLAIFTDLQQGLMEPDITPAANEFKKKRLVLLTLRREIMQTCRAAASTKGYRPLSKFFGLIVRILGGEGSGNVTYATERLLDRNLTFGLESKNQILDWIGLIKNWVEQVWDDIAAEYAALNVRYKAQVAR